MIRFYYIDFSEIESEELESRVYELLPLWRKIRLEKIKQKDKRAQSAAAGILVHRLLMDMSIGSNAVIEFNGAGKPYFADRKNGFFNIAHSEKYAVLAYSDREIGCDIEKYRTVNPRLADRFFGELEKKQISECKDSEEKYKRFLRIWTAKESFVKYTGTGIDHNFSKFDVELGDDLRVIHGLPDRNICIRELYIDNDYFCSVCYEGNKDEIISLEEVKL